ncbi:hypothetical protein TSUD_342060 [Trifolium subterraneum]|nr:hypothetical protein TSUD_342060 [Trifolium subterraneum]
MIDSDALSVPSEQKLQELTLRLNLPQFTLASEEPYTGLRSSSQDKAFSMVNTTVKEQDEMFNDQLNGMHNYRYCSSDSPVLNMNQQLQCNLQSKAHVCGFLAAEVSSDMQPLARPDNLDEDTIGVNYRALKVLFFLSDQRKDTINYVISVQMLEIYNEQV